MSETCVGMPALADHIAAQREWMQSLLQRLMSVPSVAGNEHEAQEIIESAFEELQLDVTRLPMSPSRQDLPASGAIPGPYNLVGEWCAPGQVGGRTLVLCGHVDVIEPPALSLWPFPPYPARVEGDAVVGWGGLKAGLVAMLGAIRALQTGNVKLGAEVRVQSVVNEETGGQGADAVNTVLEPADGALVAGCAGPTVAVAQVGVLWLEIKVAVPPVHAASHRGDVSAVSKALAIAADLRALTEELNADAPKSFAGVPNPLAFNLGTVTGGSIPSLTPAECTIRCRIGIFPGTHPRVMLTEVQRRVSEFAARDEVLRAAPPVVNLDGFEAQGYELDPNSDFIRCLVEAFTASGTTPELVASTTATDTRSFVAMGTPAVCVGPPVENLHSIQEQVDINELVAAARRIAEFVVRWSGPSGKEQSL